MPSKPCLCDSGPPAPNPVTVVRIMSGLTWRRLSRSSASERKTRGGRLATTTSAVATSFLTISRPSRCGRIERHPELVAVHRQEHRTTASGASADRDVSAVLAALDPLDADHLGAEIAQQCGAKRPRDVAAEIEHADPIEYARHRTPPALAEPDRRGTAYSAGLGGAPVPDHRARRGLDHSPRRWQAAGNVSASPGVDEGCAGLTRQSMRAPTDG